MNIRVSDSSPHPPSMANLFWIRSDRNTKQDRSFVAIHPSLPSAPTHKAPFIRHLRAIGCADWNRCTSGPRRPENRQLSPDGDLDRRRRTRPDRRGHLLRR